MKALTLTLTLVMFAAPVLAQENDFETPFDCANTSGHWELTASHPAIGTLHYYLRVEDDGTFGVLNDTPGVLASNTAFLRHSVIHPPNWYTFQVRNQMEFPLLEICRTPGGGEDEVGKCGMVSGFTNWAGTLSDPCLSEITFGPALRGWLHLTPSGHALGILLYGSEGTTLVSMQLLGRLKHRYISELLEQPVMISNAALLSGDPENGIQGEAIWTETGADAYDIHITAPNKAPTYQRVYNELAQCNGISCRSLIVGPQHPIGERAITITNINSDGHATTSSFPTIY